MTKIEIVLSAGFARDIKHLRQKYKSVITDTKRLIQQLEAGEKPGDILSGVGFDAYKVRLPNKSAGRGKSGGFRVIYFIQIAERVVLITIYSKSEKTDIDSKTIRQLIQDTVDDKEE